MTGLDKMARGRPAADSLQICCLPIGPHADAARLPRFATDGSACFDIHAASATKVVPGGAGVACTGLAFEVPPGHVMLVFSRSGHGFTRGVRLANSVGVIDADYRGEVRVALRNDGGEPFEVAVGDRIAQAMVLPVPSLQLVLVDSLSETGRGAGGFGSTGQ